MTDEPTEMAVAFQKAEAERDRRDRQSERVKAGKPDRIAQLTEDLSELPTDDVPLSQRIYADAGLLPREEHLASLVPAVPDLGLTTGHTVSNNVEHPKHYNMHPSGVECIQVVRHHDFNVGSAIKYLWRLGLKDDVSSNSDGIDADIQDLKKAIWYLQDEILMREAARGA